MRWTVLIDGLRGTDSQRYSWCRCVCGTYRLTRTKSIESCESQSCGCLSNELSRQRILILNAKQTGDRHPKWMGGVNNRGTLAWANGVLQQNNSHAITGGHSPMAATALEVVELFANFDGVCRICNAKLDKLQAGNLVLDHDHLSLLGMLRDLKGKFMLSGYRSETYDEHAVAYGWTRHDNELTTLLAVRRKKNAPNAFGQITNAKNIHKRPYHEGQPLAQFVSITRGTAAVVVGGIRADKSHANAFASRRTKHSLGNVACR